MSPEAPVHSRLAAAHARAAHCAGRLQVAAEQARQLRLLSQERRLHRAVQRAVADPATRLALLDTADSVVTEQESWVRFVRDELEG